MLAAPEPSQCMPESLLRCQALVDLLMSACLQQHELQSYNIPSCEVQSSAVDSNATEVGWWCVLGGFQLALALCHLQDSSADSLHGGETKAHSNGHVISYLP